MLSFIKYIIAKLHIAEPLPFPPQNLDDSISKLIKWKQERGYLNNEKTTWRLLAHSPIHALNFFFKIDYIDVLLLKHKKMGNGFTALHMKLSKKKYIELVIMPNNLDDIAEIKFVNKNQKIKSIKFIKKL